MNTYYIVGTPIQLRDDPMIGDYAAGQQILSDSEVVAVQAFERENPGYEVVSVEIVKDSAGKWETR